LFSNEDQLRYYVVAEYRDHSEVKAYYDTELVVRSYEDGVECDRLALDRIDSVYDVTTVKAKKNYRWESWLVVHYDAANTYSIFELRKGGKLEEVMYTAQKSQNGRLNFMDVDNDGDLEVVVLVEDYMWSSALGDGVSVILNVRGVPFELPEEAEKSRSGVIVVELGVNEDQPMRYYPALTVK